MRKAGRARQPSAKSLGLLPWQREFWLLMLEHALANKLGPPDLSMLEGFSAPAVTQYSVTTPELLRSFQKYNAGKPYHRQVRPFGFMVMFQQSEDADPTTVMRVVAPFNRNPVKAARKAFDRDTGAVVRPSQLKTYCDALRNYHNHPEAKFLNGERGDRGPTQRRHIVPISIIHIGKEANKLESQQVTGIDPHAQVEFHVNTATAGRLNVIAAAVKKIGPTRVAREAGLSRKYISAIAGSSSAAQATLSKIERAISGLETADADQSAKAERMLSALKAECKRVGLRQVARFLNLSPSTMSRVISGSRKITPQLMRRAIVAFPAISRAV